MHRAFCNNKIAFYICMRLIQSKLVFLLSIASKQNYIKKKKIMLQQQFCASGHTVFSFYKINSKTAFKIVFFSIYLMQHKNQL